MDGFTSCFAGLEDPRTGNAGRHDLLEMLMIALCTVLSGGEDCTDMAEFARAKLGFLRGFLKLEHGAPSHDTFSRLFRLLDPEQFRTCFQRFMARFAEACQGVVAIDGKVLRRSFDKASGKSALHMVCAWSCEQRLVLGQVATDAKSRRDHGGARAAADAQPRGLHRDRRRPQLPTRDRPASRRSEGRLRHGTEGKPRHPARRRAERFWTIQKPSCRSATARLTATTAASRPAPPRFRPTFHGCRRTIAGQVWPRSARSSASARPP